MPVRCWSAACIAALVLAASGNARPGVLALDWYHPGGGNWIGKEGFFVADVDADGRDEIVAAVMSHEGINTSWFVHRWDGATYQQEFAAPPEDQPVKAMTVAQADEDAALEIVVARGNSIDIWDGLSYRLERTIVTPLTQEILAVGLSDIDLDGQAELVCSDSIDLLILDLASEDIEHTVGGIGFPTDLAIGNVDGDAPLEVVVVNGQFGSGHVLDGNTGEVEWERTSGFGEWVRLGDFNGDSSLEIVGGYDSSKMIEIYDVETEGVVDQFPLDDGIAGLEVADMNNAGLPEIIYVDPFGDAYILDAVSGSSIWNVSASAPSRAIAVGNTDDDSALEVVWSGGGPGSNERIFIGDTSAPAVEWQSHAYTAVFADFGVAPLALNGAEKLLLGIREFDFEGTVLLVLDAGTRSLEEIINNPEFGTGAPRLTVAQLDGDEQREVLFSTENPSGYQTLFALDSDGFAVQWDHEIKTSHRFSSLAVGDVDGDSNLEVIAALEPASSGNTPFIDVLDGETGTLEWRSPATGPEFQDPFYLRIADVDTDPQVEIVLGNFEDNLVVISADTQSIDLTSQDLDLTALDTPTLIGGSKAEIVVGNGDGVLSIIDPSSGLPTATLADLGTQVTGLRFFDYSADQALDVVTVQGETLVIYDLEAEALLASSPFTVSPLHDLLSLDDMDQDGIPEIVISSWGDGILVFGLGLGSSIFADGFESGDTSAWSTTIP